MASELFDDLPVRVFPGNFPFSEGVKVASADLDALTIGSSARQGPFRYARVGAVIDEMLVVSIMHVRQAFESTGQGSPDIFLALEARSPGLVSSRHLQHAVMCEEAHDPV